MPLILGRLTLLRLVPRVRRVVGAGAVGCLSALLLAGTPAALAAGNDTEYAGASDAEAAAVTKEHFDELLDDSSSTGLPLDADQKVVAYRGTQTALVSDGKDRSLLHSSFPLRATDSDGTLRRISLDLEDHSGFVTPENPLAPVRIGDTIADGLTFPDIGVFVRPLGVDGATQGDVSDGRVHFANANEDADLDYVVSPTMTGAETFDVLRSVDSPERLRYAVQLPIGAILEPDPGALGGLRVVRNDQILLTIAPMVATDADHQQVTGSYEITEQGFDIKIAHRDQTVKYPILVDPSFWLDQRHWDLNAAITQKGWAWDSIGSWYPLYNTTNGGIGARALQIWNGQSYYGQGGWGRWSFVSQGDSFISNAYLSRFAFIKNANNACIDGGLMRPDQNYGAGAYFGTCTGFGAQEVGFASQYADRTNRLAMRWVGGPSAFYSSTSLAYLGGAAMVIQDDRAPVNLAVSGLPASDTWTATKPTSVTITAKDNGVGLSKVSTKRDSDPTADTTTCPTAADSWNAQSGNLWCPLATQTKTAPISVPEGSSTWTFGATDLVNNTATTAYTLKLDTTKPTIQTPSGSLYNARDSFVGPERDYSFTVTATDGAETPLSAQRSGVSSLVATLDGSPMTDGADNTPCTQAQGSCQRTITPKLSKAQIANLTDGSTHTVSIVAKDALGNLSDPTTFSFRVDKARPTIQASGRLYDARTDSVGPDDGDYGLSVAATDGSTTPTTAQRSGVVEVTATLDNAPMSGSPKAASCTQTGYSCQLTLPTALTMEQIDNLDPGAHTIAMTATDAAGNKSDPLSFAFTYDEGKVVTAGAETPAPSGEFTTPASCETSAPTQPDVVALTSALTQTLAQATQTAQSALPNANALVQSVSAPTAQLLPRLNLASGVATATGTLTKLRISEQFKQGFSLGAGPGGVCFAPTRTTDKVLDGAIALGDSAMLFANSDVATSTILRPTPTGAESLTVLNSSAAPQSFSWNVNPGPGRQLTTLPDGSIAIVNPHPTEPAGDDAAFAADTQTALVNAGLDQLEPNVTEPSGVTALANAIGNTPAELTKAHNDFARAQNQTLDEVIFTIPRPWAIDAAGQSVPVALSTQGNTLTMTLSPSATAQYPIVADPAPTASAAKRGAPMRLMTFNTRSARPRDDSPDNGDPTYSLHVTHARRVSNVIWHQVGSNSHDRRVPSVVGVQEMCKSDLDIIVEDLNTRDAGTNTLWRADFRRFRSANGCPIGTTDNPGGTFGNAIIRNVNLTGSPVSARYPTPFQLNEKRSDGTYRYERRGYIHDKVDVRGRTFDFFTTHLVVQDSKNSPDDSRTVKQNQSQFLLDQIDGITNPRVATGDFNSLTSAAPSINVYRYWPDAGFHDVDRCGMRSGDTPRLNCEEATTESGARIDYIFQKGLTINSSNVANVNDETSDHDTLVSSASIP